MLSLFPFLSCLADRLTVFVLGLNGHWETGVGGGKEERIGGQAPTLLDTVGLFLDAPQALVRSSAWVT